MTGASLTDSRMPETAHVTGLTADEVALRVEQGKTNANTDVKTKSVGQIFRSNICTLFNLVNVCMAALVAITGQWRNILFMGVVLCNVVVGIWQELRAKRLVDRLTILTQKRVLAVRGGAEVELAPSDLVLDDVIRLAHGDQVPADCVVVKGSAYCDESLLTGESRAVEKDPGDELLSGSFIESGSLYARVTRVGMEGYAARLGAEAKHAKPVRSEIRHTLDAIIRLGTYGLVPLGLALFLRTYLQEGATLNDAILGTVAAVVGMIPQGLVLLTSSVLAIATTRLAMRKVLVQQTYCVETLARVDVLCLDKTGTITTGDMEVSRVVGEGASERDVLAGAATVCQANVEDANDTARAVLARAEEMAEAGQTSVEATVRAVPFSSARKYSGCVTASGRALVMGAAQFVLGEDGLARYEELAGQFDRLERVLVVGEAAGFDAEGGIEGPVRLLGLLGIRDQVRSTAAQTIEYFREQGVEVRVISGDDPRTASAIAGQVGIEGADRWVDASRLRNPEDLRAAVREKRVFGRVTPEQKREIVRMLQAEGHTVAMTGDGVNDVLALREADCSVSVASGSAAARNIAEIVLADNDFAHMPEVVAEGRRSINNLQRSASLFLVKTVYTAALTLICIVMPPYPFIPIQMSLISSAIIGIPSFVLALEPNHERIRGYFLANVMARSLPASVAITAALFVELLACRGLGLSFAQTSTVCMLVTCAVGFALIWRISQPLTPLRMALLAFVVGYVAVGCTVFGDFNRVAPPTATMVVLVCTVGTAAVVLFNGLFGRSLAAYEHNERFNGFLRRLEGHDGD